MANTDEELSSVVFHSPQWIANAGGWIHSNNGQAGGMVKQHLLIFGEVLFYFSESPFFDRTSTNQSIITQSQGIPEREYENLSTRKRFESKLAQLTGLQYVVAHDPLESNAKFKGPEGDEQGDVWVIRRQNRHKTEGRTDDVTVTGFYYIMNQAIFQAPSVSSVLSYRMLNTTMAMNQIFSKASELALFSVSHGHTYHKPIQKPIQNTAVSVNASRNSTPIPESQQATTQALATDHVKDSTDDSMARTLREALNMSMRYGREYMDEMTLTGEPGNFRVSKTRDTNNAGGQLRNLNNGQAATVKASTPVPLSRAASPLPNIQTNVPPVVSKKSSAKSPTGDNPMKPKRRKSRVANPTP